MVLFTATIVKEITAVRSNLLISWFYELISPFLPTTAILFVLYREKRVSPAHLVLMVMLEHLV